MARNVTIDGLPEAIQRLNRAHGQVVTAQRIQPILNEGGGGFQKSVVARAPSRTGDTRRALVVKVGKSRKQGEVVALMTLDAAKIRKKDRRGRAVRYPYMVEHGTGAHTILPSRKFLRFEATRSVRTRNARGRITGSERQTSTVFARRVKHPGFRAVKFFAKGVRAATPAVKAQIETDIKALLDEI